MDFLMRNYNNYNIMLWPYNWIGLTDKSAVLYKLAKFGFLEQLSQLSTRGIY